MSQPSELFEDFPEDNAANYVNGRFDPKAAEAMRRRQAQRAANEPCVDEDVRTIAQRHRPHPKK